MSMPLRATVKNGRIIVDEPTDLPDGAELTLVPVVDDEEPVELAPAELAELDRRIERSRRGNTVAGDAVFSELHSRG
jgi:hypothetical protein